MKQTRIQPKQQVKVIASMPGHPPKAGSPPDLAFTPQSQIRGER